MSGQATTPEAGQKFRSDIRRYEYTPPTPVHLGPEQDSQWLQGGLGKAQHPEGIWKILPAALPTLLPLA